MAPREPLMHYDPDSFPTGEIIIGLKGSEIETNLKAAFAGETHAKAEKSHAGKVQRTLESLMAGA